MAETAELDVPVPGLRERKKLRTRATLIEAAAELCVKQGYDGTTVEQIAAAADVSPRTFSRYFPTKQSVVAAINDDMDVLLAQALRNQPTGITEYEALLRSCLSVFESASGGETPAFKRMAVLIQIVNGSESFRGAALSFQRSVSDNAGIRVLAERMGCAVDDTAVGLVADVWTLMFARAFSSLGGPDGPPVTPESLCRQLRTTYESLRRTWTPCAVD